MLVAIVPTSRAAASVIGWTVGIESARFAFDVFRFRRLARTLDAILGGRAVVGVLTTLGRIVGYTRVAASVFATSGRVRGTIDVFVARFAYTTSVVASANRTSVGRSDQLLTRFCAYSYRAAANRFNVAVIGAAETLIVYARLAFAVCTFLCDFRRRLAFRNFWRINSVSVAGR